MASERDYAQVLRATLCEIERGLFHVSYRTDRAECDLLGLPAYQIGSGAAAAKQQIEASARQCGFTTVIWDYELLLGPIDDLSDAAGGDSADGPPPAVARVAAKHASVMPAAWRVLG